MPGAPKIASLVPRPVFNLHAVELLMRMFTRSTNPGDNSLSFWIKGHLPLFEGARRVTSPHLPHENTTGNKNSSKTSRKRVDPNRDITTSHPKSSPLGNDLSTPSKGDPSVMARHVQGCHQNCPQLVSSPPTVLRNYAKRTRKTRPMSLTGSQCSPKPSTSSSSNRLEDNFKCERCGLTGHPESV